MTGGNCFGSSVTYRFPDTDCSTRSQLRALQNTRRTFHLGLCLSAVSPHTKSTGHSCRLNRSQPNTTPSAAVATCSMGTQQTSSCSDVLHPWRWWWSRTSSKNKCEGKMITSRHTPNCQPPSSNWKKTQCSNYPKIARKQHQHPTNNRNNLINPAKHPLGWSQTA